MWPFRKKPSRVEFIARSIKEFPDEWSMSPSGVVLTHASGIVLWPESGEIYKPKVTRNPLIGALRRSERREIVNACLYWASWNAVSNGAKH